MHIPEASITDCDVTSLYPAAMSKIGFPTGPASIMTPEMIDYYNNPINLMKISSDTTSVD